MTSERVEDLYGKFEKGVAKKERGELKTSLENCDNEKYEQLKKLELESKSPVKEFVGLIGIVATVVGFIFILFNLLVYAYAVPSNTDKIEFATKLSADMTEYAQIATDELDAAYSEGAQEWTTDYILEYINAEYDYDTLSGDLTKFKNDYKIFKDALETAQTNYADALGSATDEAGKSAALSDFQSALNAAESNLINGLNGLVVLDGQDLSEKYTAYKNALATYKGVLSNEDSTDDEIAEAKETFVKSTAKTNFETLLKEVSEYLALAKTTLNTIDTFNTYNTALKEYQNYISDKNSGKNPTVKAEPALLVGIEEYFGKDSSSTGALKDINTLYNAYSAADTEYEANLDKAPADATLLWWSAPLSAEVNKLIVTTSELQALQNDFILHLNLYKTVINGLPERIIEEVVEYYNADGLYGYSAYDENLNKVTFSYFSCKTSTIKSVIGDTDFEANKTEINKAVENFKAFEYTANLSDEDYLTESYYDGLVNSVNEVKEAISEFNAVVAGMTNISSQTITMARSANSTSDILSMIAMVFDIIFVVILAAYSVALILTYRSKAQRDNLKAIYKAIND